MTLNRRTAVIGGSILLVIAIGIGIVAAAGGGDDEAADTTSTTAAATTTTTEPLPACPLTGRPAKQRRFLTRPALVVKIDNVDPASRPQVGVNSADVVYEERVEGSVTRWMAIFHCSDASPIGPVRSARTSDIPLFTPLNRPLFAWSGSNDIFVARIQAAAIVDVGHTPAVDQYYRESGRRAPHNLFIRGSAQMIAAHGPDGAIPPPALFVFREKGQQLKVGRKVKGVHINFGSAAGSAPVDYEWTGKGWARSQKATPHVDSNGKRIVPDNVIVQFVRYVSSGVNDGTGRPIPEASLIGEGEAWVLTAGRLIEARWRKPSLDAVTTYTDNNGTPIELTKGRTWVALPPAGGATIVPAGPASP